MTKIKIFGDIDANELSRTVNDFIKDKDVVDIKYNTVVVKMSVNERKFAINDRVMVVYKE